MLDDELLEGRRMIRELETLKSQIRFNLIEQRDLLKLSRKLIQRVKLIESANPDLDFIFKIYTERWLTHSEKEKCFFYIFGTLQEVIFDFPNRWQDQKIKYNLEIFNQKEKRSIRDEIIQEFRF